MQRIVGDFRMSNIGRQPGWRTSGSPTLAHVARPLTTLALARRQPTVRICRLNAHAHSRNNAAFGNANRLSADSKALVTGPSASWHKAADSPEWARRLDRWLGELKYRCRQAAEDAAGVLETNHMSHMPRTRMQACHPLAMRPPAPLPQVLQLAPRHVERLAAVCAAQPAGFCAG